MRLINVQGRLFNLDGSLYRVHGVPIELHDDDHGDLGDGPDGKAIELISWEDYEREREAEWARRTSESVHLTFDTDEIVFQCPLPSDGLQKRYSSPTVNEWVCFAPGYPAWEMDAR